jgi:hypothetical protein
VGCFRRVDAQLAAHKPKIKKFALQGADMSSPGVMHARKSEPIEWRPLDPLDLQEAQAYPVSYEEARRRLLDHLLSMTTVPRKESEPTAVAVPPDSFADNPEFEWNRAPLRECADKSTPIKDDPAAGKLEEFCYVSSFDRLTSRKSKAGMQSAPVSIGAHLRNVLAVTAALSVSALVYTSLGGGFPRLSAGVHSLLGDRAAKVRVILPGHDLGNLPKALAQMPPLSVREASADQTASTQAGGTERLLYSTASIAFTPLK